VTTEALAAARQVSFSVELRRSTRGDHENAERILDLPARMHSLVDLARLLHAWRSIWSDVRAECGPAGHDESARLLVSAVRAVQQTAAGLRSLAMIDESDAGEIRALVEPGAGPDATTPTTTTTPMTTSTTIGGDGAGDGGPFAALLATEPGLWAVSYVLRGSRVGGTVLAPLFAEQLGLPLGVASEYHADATTGRSWVTFQRRLDDWGRCGGPDGRDAVVHLAREAFALVGARLSAASSPTSGPTSTSTSTSSAEASR
jgi:hypothetical protein